MEDQQQQRGLTGQKTHQEGLELGGLVHEEKAHPYYTVPAFLKINNINIRYDLTMLYQYYKMAI